MPKRLISFDGHMGRIRLILTLCLGVFVPTKTHAHPAFGFKQDGVLDKATISRAYFEGEFSAILAPLEMYQQHFPVTATKDDSIFVYKYLSVIYAADSSTRKKAESCMVQLIKMKPTIELLDLYISDNIASIFKNVKQSYLQQQKYVREHDLVGNEKTATENQNTSAVEKAKPRPTTWIPWTVGAVGVAAVATTAYFILDDNHKTTNQPSSFKP